MTTGIRPFLRLLLQSCLTLVTALNPGRKPFSRRFTLGVLFVLLLGASVFYTRAGTHTRVYAAPSTTVNFQARLSSTAGAIVPDGSYSVVFNLYNDPTTGTTQWTETQSVTVKAGYLSVYLGTATPFPGTIDWSQAQYLTMNVNGDGEMSPRLKLTAVPYAFRANQADTLTITGGTVTGDNLAQLAPAGTQSVNSTVAGLRINQVGSGGLLQLAAGGVDMFTISNTGDVSAAGSMTVSGSSLNVGSTSLAGSLVLSDGSSNTVSLTASGVGSSYALTLPSSAPLANQCLRAGSTVATDLTFSTCGSSKVMQTYDAFGLNQAANATTALGTILNNTSATTFSTAVAGTTEVRMSRAGSFRGCSIANSAAVTAGTVSVRFRKNGANTSTTDYCTLNTTNTRSNTEDIDPGIETFAAGDTIGVALISVGLAPITLEHRVSFTVEFGTGSDSGIFNFQDAYNNSNATELTLDAVRGGMTIRDNTTPITGNLLEVQNNAGGTTYFGVTATGTTSANTLTISSGGINNTSGGIVNAGSITGVGTNITGTGAVTLASGGAGALTLDSASNTLVIAASDTSLQRTAAGGFSLDLNDGANTTFSITNTGAGLAGLDVEGGITAGNTDAFSVNTDGDVTSAFTALNGTTTSNGTSGAGTSTALVVTNATNFDIGNYVQVNAANCGGTGINPCYAKITNKVGNTLTISPALRWTNGVTVNEYHIPEIGGTNTANTLANRYGRGFFISGVAAGNGTTYYNEDSIDSSLASFDLLNTGVATLNIGGAATNINLGTTGTTVNVVGGLSVNGSSIIGSGGDLTNITSISGSAGLTISSGGAGDLTLDSASGKLVIAANDTTLQRTAAGTYTIDLIDGANTTLALGNSGAGTASLNLTDGSLAIAGTTAITSTRTASLTGITSTGTIQFGSLAAGGIIKSDTSGNLSIATGGTDYELPLTITSGLTRSTNTVRLGGNLTQATDIGLNGNALTITGSGGSIFTAFAAGGIDVRNDSTAAMAIRNAAGTRSYLTVNTTGNLVQVGSSTTDATAILSVLDSYNTATDPTGVNGGSYYNSANNKNRCYEDGYWSDCNDQGVLGETTLGTANGTISVSLAKNYEFLECHLEVKSRSGSAQVQLRFNNSSAAANYSWNSIYINGVTVNDAQSASDTRIQLSSGIGSTAPFNANMTISNFSDTRKGVEWTANSVEAIGTNLHKYAGSGSFLPTAQISSVQFVTTTGTFAAGSHAWCTGRNVR